MPNFDAVIFDMDGVITKTAAVHALAWKQMFDEYLRLRERSFGEPFTEFAQSADYLSYVDGKPRYKGVEAFLDSRGIKIPFGRPEDKPGQETICGLGNRKNERFHDAIATNGVGVYDSSVTLVLELLKAGVKVAIATSSKNCRLILEKTGLLPLFATRVDGVISATLGLHGKPEPDIFIMASKSLGVVPERAVVVEDAVSGVQAGANGQFALIIGVARENNARELLFHGADCVVTDLSAASVDFIDNFVSLKRRRSEPFST